MSIEIPGINTKTVLNLYDDDVEVYKSILCSFISNVPKVLDKIRSVSSETLQEYKIKIHALKGISESVGAEKIMTAASKLEAMAKKGDLVGILARNGDFLEETDILVDNIRNWLADNLEFSQPY
jgi:HPt (histidine-containing phosphotransfer) domain-containing protein